MAMPGLDTDPISWIAFWNALDNGAQTITPTDTETVFDTSTEYNNGLEGQFTVSFSTTTDRLVNARVKDDGWIVVWFSAESDEDSTQGWGADLHGPYDIINDWTAPKSASDFTQNTLERAVKSLRDALSNSGNTNYNAGDVGLWNYDTPDATSFAWREWLTSHSGSDTASITPGAGDTLHSAWAAAAGSDDNGLSMDWDSTGIDHRILSGDQVGTRDGLTRGEIAAGETTTIESNLGQDGETWGNEVGYSKINVFVVFS